MPFSRKRRAQLQAALAKRHEAKKTVAHVPDFEKFPPKPDTSPIHLFECPDDCLDDILQHVHWEGLSDSEEESEIEMSEPEDNILDDGKDAFETMMQARKTQEPPSSARREQVVIASDLRAVAGSGRGFRASFLG